MYAQDGLSQYKVRIWKMKTKRRTRWSFTLIELMAVTTIVIALTALLLPALERAKGIAKSTYCKSNLRQMMTLTNLYKKDNNLNLPYTSTWLVDFSFCADYVDTYGVAMCPDTDDKVSVASDLVGNTSYHYMGSSYDWDKNFADSSDGVEYGFDSANSQIASLLSDREQKVIYDKSDVSHYGQYNVAFLDSGHVEAQAASTFGNFWYFDDTGNLDFSGDRTRNCNRWMNRHRYRHGNTYTNGNGNGYGSTDGDAGSESNENSSTTSDDGSSTDDGQTNNGHGNNEDGVDCSNPGQGSGGPNGEVDASGDVDDEVSNGNSGNNGNNK